ncbi:MAG: TolC family protein, partial [Rhodospirillales bacterium]|nr:TolC family protein [Rhodospirillales bacterium]
MRLTYSSAESSLPRHAIVRRLLPFAFVSGLLAAPVAAADTLQTAIADAHAWHPAIQTARAQVRIAAASVDEVGLGNSLTATGDFGASMTERTAELSDGSSQSEAKPVFTSARLSLSKRIFDFGRIRGRVGVEESLLDAARYQLQVVEQQVLHDAVIAYLNVFRARARLELAIKGEELVQSDLKATQERFEVGDVTPTDVA